MLPRLANYGIISGKNRVDKSSINKFSLNISSSIKSINLYYYILRFVIKDIIIDETAYDEGLSSYFNLIIRL